jgi:DAK2 domain fusion protein YloV
MPSTREASEALREKVYQNQSIDIIKAFDILLEEANASLQRTPELLPVLKEVGVVDSGGAGLLKVLEGFRSAINGKVVEKNMATITEEPMQQKAGSMVEGDEFGYCTEFILRLPENPQNDGKKAFAEKRFTSVLASHGNSLVVVRDEDIVKVHVHTLAPGNVLVYAQQFGEFVKLKIENMSEQHSQLQEDNRDPLKQNPVNEEPKEYAIISVSVGDGIESMFRDLGVTEIVSGGQTMNPSTEDFIEAIKRCNAKKVFILPNNSNIILAATQACSVAPDGVECRVIPTKTIPQGLSACMMFNPEGSFDDNEEEMKEAMANVKTGQVTFAIRDTVIDDVEVKKDQFIALFGKKIVSCNKDKIEVTLTMLSEMVDESSSIITLIYGEDATSEEVEKLSERIQELYPDVDLDVREGNQPVYSFIIAVE